MYIIRLILFLLSGGKISFVDANICIPIVAAAWYALLGQGNMM